MLSAKQAALAAEQASYRAYNEFTAASWAGGEHARVAYWQMRAAQENAASMRAAQVQLAAATFPALTPQWQVTFPAWSLPALASIPLALLHWQLAIRRRRILRGLCGHCGYDLHGNTSGICPECGTSLAIVLCRSITVNGKRVLSITPSIPLTAVGS